MLTIINTIPPIISGIEKSAYGLEVVENNPNKWLCDVV